jgi:hypothetical protein
MFIKIIKEKRNLIKEFMKEHKEYLPKFSPQGQPLKWRIFVYQDGEYDIYTGKQSGNYKVGISQKLPYGGVTCDPQVYTYNIKNKTLEEVHGCLWQ